MGKNMTPIDDGFGEDGDHFYEMLMQSHDGLSESQSGALNARLVLLMANQIGELETLKSLIAEARGHV